MPMCSTHHRYGILIGLLLTVLAVLPFSTAMAGKSPSADAGHSADTGPSAAAGVPQRVASLDWGLAATLTAMGHPPVAVADTAGYDEWVVTPPMPDGVINLGSRTEPNLEILQQAHPDLILITPYQAPLRPMLERIAPVLSVSLFVDVPDGGQGHPLQNSIRAARLLGRTLNLESEAEALITRANQTFDAANRALDAATHADGRRVRKTPLYILSLIDPRHAWVYGKSSLFHDVMVRLGLRDAWTRDTNYWGFSSTGFDGLSISTDAVLLLLKPVPAETRRSLKTNVLWNTIPSVHSGQMRELDPVLMFGTVPSAMRLAHELVQTLTGSPLTGAPPIIPPTSTASLASSSIKHTVQP